MDDVTKRCRGFAFVIFKEKSIIDKIMERNEHVIRGKTVDPKICNMPEDKNYESCSVSNFSTSSVQQSETCSGISQIPYNIYQNGVQNQQFYQNQANYPPFQQNQFEYSTPQYQYTNQQLLDYQTQLLAAQMLNPYGLGQVGFQGYPDYGIATTLANQLSTSISNTSISSGLTVQPPFIPATQNQQAATTSTETTNKKNPEATETLDAEKNQ